MAIVSRARTNTPLTALLALIECSTPTSTGTDRYIPRWDAIRDQVVRSRSAADTSSASLEERTWGSSPSATLGPPAVPGGKGEKRAR